MQAPRIPGYALTRRLGRGGMGEVWLATRSTVGGIAKPVAIKIVHLDVQAPGHARGFLEEARISTSLSHSNIAQVFDVGIADSVAYMAMEVVDGVDLRHLWGVLSGHGELIDPQIAAHIIGQVLRALQYAHSLHRGRDLIGIVHRDVSPHNVMVSVSGEVKLLDFGIASTVLDPTSGHHVKRETALHGAGAVRRSPSRPASGSLRRGRHAARTPGRLPLSQRNDASRAVSTALGAGCAAAREQSRTKLGPCWHRGFPRTPHPLPRRDPLPPRPHRPDRSPAR